MAFFNARKRNESNDRANFGDGVRGYSVWPCALGDGLAYPCVMVHFVAATPRCCAGVVRAAPCGGKDDVAVLGIKDMLVR
ncbi:hypothetical protein ASB57_22935 [Bordetella sp. N]|nr:hypothetical protein ASB57_22935 [Bordetella sp. N]